MRKVSIPIYLKLIAVFLTLVISSLTFYVVLALDLFKEDKVAYVFDATNNYNEQVAESFEVQNEKANLALDLLENASVSQRLLNDIFKAHDSLKGFAILETKLGVTKKVLRGIKLVESAIKDLDGTLVLSPTKIDGVDLLYKTKKIGSTKQAYVFFGKDFVQFSENDLFASGLLLKNGASFLSKGFLKDDGLLEDIKAQVVQNKTYIYNGKEKLIVSLKTVWDGKATSITLAHYNKALNASLQLRQKSLVFGLLIIGIVILITMFFSRYLLRPVRSLFNASVEFSKNNFSYRAEVKTKDELGVLADSFNMMADDIVKYMEEMKEKHRLENELATAKLVQKSFFPSDHVVQDNFELSAYYRPATECGGDWWAHFSDRPGRDIIMLIDVTGHGTPAALMTAVVHNSLTAFKKIVEFNPDFLKSPVNIAEYLNSSFCNVENNLFASGFVAVIEKNKIAYVNASHNPPFLIKGNKKSFSKEDLIPLMDKLGPRLGESLSSTYEEVVLQYCAGDRLTIYTDGILEAVSSDNKQFGNRRLSKAILESMSDTPVDATKNITSTFYNFIEGCEPDDDITMLNIGFKA